VAIKGAGKDFNPDRDLSLALKSASPDQPPGWNDPYLSLNLKLVLKGKRLAESVKTPWDKKAGPFLTLPLEESEPFLESIKEMEPKKLQTGRGIVLVFPTPP